MFTLKFRLQAWSGRWLVILTALILVAGGELTELEQICPGSPEWHAQMATIPLPACDPEEMKRRK